ncbi:MAG: hypothetical protein LAP61_12845 [Acidobacteriia bacterium]|nr:hypothetical protein [Terriglobia bacterium]
MRNCFIRILRHWNWKSALLSSLSRSAVFFFTNLHAGSDAAIGAMLAEFAYRSLTAGFYGGLTQAFRAAEPRWLATLSVMFGMPVVSHTIEFTVHWLRGTPNLRASMAASVAFTLVSTLFHLHAMRRGVLIVGKGGRSLAADFASLPRTLVSFVTSGFGLLDRRLTTENQA